MFKKVVTTIVTASILMFSLTAFALTLDEAKTNIDKRASDKKLGAKDHSQAIATLQGLVKKGVPVEHAYQVVEASINQGMKGKDLAEIAKSVESVGPAARRGAASVAANAIQHKYNAQETAQMANTFGKTVAAGAPAGGTLQVMSSGINKGLGTGKIITAASTYSGEIKSGTAPDKASENAMRTMDRQRTAESDQDGFRDMNHGNMGNGSGMDHGFRMGNGAGSGMGPGMMGGPRM